MSFVHLHTHSEYSLLQGSCRLKAIAKKAASLQMPAVALTDLGNMFGAIEFYFACKDAGVKPILGLEVFVAENRFEKKNERDAWMGPPRLVLLATNFVGYQSLCRISSLGYQEGFYWKPRVDIDLLSKNKEGLICLTGGLRGLLSETYLKEGAEKAKETLATLKSIYQDNLFVELNRRNGVYSQDVDTFLKNISKEMNVPVVAANDVHYLNPEDSVIQDVLVCIGENRTLSDETRPKLPSQEFYFKSTEQMLQLFHDIPEAISNSVEIANRIDLQFKLKDAQGKPVYHLPTFPTEGGKGLKEEIRQRSYEGLEVRFSEGSQRGEVVADEQKSSYYQRLDYELSVIDRMGFNGYFLIVQDFINWAKNKNIPVGPGRGSGAGSLVAYCLRITDLDPFPSKLLFERFLNPERISMPDFDIDFCQDRRPEVIEYVTQKYGEKSVSQIITYGKLQTRAAIKDVGRVLGMTFAETDAITKLVPEKLGITINEAVEQEPRLKELMELDPKVNTCIDLARRIEGLVRNAGIHAAGVIIADGDLAQHAPLYRGSENENVVQYDMKHAEKMGLIKFDFLGLKTLSHIQRALDLIEKNRGVKIQTHEISLKDPGIYEIMTKGDTAGVFQFEGDGITQAIRMIKPSSFADITAINALYRPGPMAMIPEFAARKHGEQKVEFAFPELKEILEETYGIIVYQEQVMGISSIIAGYSLGEADMLRRAMGKKIKEEMDKHRERFIKGAKEKNFDLKKAEEVFELMYKFADYGFNKSHAAAYCVIAAQTAWLKKYYPVEFFAALLSTELSNTDNIVKYSKDAQKHGIEINPPSVNKSQFLFSAIGDTIFFGLGAIKGVGESAVEAIIQAREAQEQKAFSSVENFFQSVDIKRINKKVIECLIKAGAFDEFDIERSQLMAGYQLLLDRAVNESKDRELGQSSLFDLGTSDLKKVELPDVKPWPRSASLAYEKEVLGFYLSDHPLKSVENILQFWTTCPIIDLPQIKMLPQSEQKAAPPPPSSGPASYRRGQENKPRVVIGGLLTSCREIITKKGTRMAFAYLEDLSGSCEIIVFPDVFAKTEAVLKSNAPLLVTGLLENEDGRIKLMVETVNTVDDSLNKAKSITWKLHKLDVVDYDKLNGVMREHPGNIQVNFEINVPEFERKVILKNESEAASGVKLSPEFFESLYMTFGRTDFVDLKMI